MFVHSFFVEMCIRDTNFHRMTNDDLMGLHKSMDLQFQLRDLRDSVKTQYDSQKVNIISSLFRLLWVILFGIGRLVAVCKTLCDTVLSRGLLSLQNFLPYTIGQPIFCATHIISV